MGFFSFFSSAPSEKAINSQVTKAKEGYAQSEYRMAAMEKLLKWNTPESLLGLLERFCVVVQSLHWDQEEKKWLVEEIIKNQDNTKNLVIDFILKKDEITHCLICIKKILNNDQEYIDLLKKALVAREPSNYRMVQSKKELINELNQYYSEELDDLVIPYLNDHSDDVQCLAISFLANSSNSKTHEELAKLLKSEEHSSRVLRTLALALLEKEILINGELVESLRDEFVINNNKIVRINH